ncbi:GNAT family N-acetyltransferase [Streptodolium elevatio]
MPRRPNGRGRTRVAQLPDETVVGLIMGGPADPKLGHDAEIYAFAVRPDRQGRGHGRALLRTVAADLSADGLGSLAVRVLGSNEAARRFYASQGGALAGEAPPDEVVYSWPRIAVLL